MARLGTFNRAVIALAGAGLAVLLLAAPGVAQEAGRPGPNIEGIMASSDSLAFGTTAADSADEIPVIHQKMGGLMGLIANSRLGKTGVGDLYVRGGVFMHWLLASAILGLAFTIERFWTLNRAKTDTRKLIGSVITTMRTEGVQAAALECQRTRGPIAAILYAGLQKADSGPDAVEKACGAAGALEMAFLERGLNWLTTVINIAPLIGFLGTVSGMIHAFEAIAAAEQVNAKLVASGISEALITTAAGLIIAIPVAAGYNYFVSVNDRFVTEMEESAGELIDAITRMGAGK